MHVDTWTRVWRDGQALTPRELLQIIAAVKEGRRRESREVPRLPGSDAEAVTGHSLGGPGGTTGSENLKT